MNTNENTQIEEEQKLMIELQDLIKQEEKTASILENLRIDFQSIAEMEEKQLNEYFEIELNHILENQKIYSKKNQENLLEQQMKQSENINFLYELFEFENCQNNNVKINGFSLLNNWAEEKVIFLKFFVNF